MTDDINVKMIPLRGKRRTGVMFRTTHKSYEESKRTMTQVYSEIQQWLTDNITGNYVLHNNAWGVLAEFADTDDAMLCFMRFS